MHLSICRRRIKYLDEVEMVIMRFLVLTRPLLAERGTVLGFWCKKQQLELRQTKISSVWKQKHKKIIEQFSFMYDNNINSILLMMFWQTAETAL